MGLANGSALFLFQSRHILHYPGRAYSYSPAPTITASVQGMNILHSFTGGRVPGAVMQRNTFTQGFARVPHLAAGNLRRVPSNSNVLRIDDQSNKDFNKSNF
jgi:hypothetical protein